MNRSTILLATTLALAGCAVQDGRTADAARSALIGVSAEDLSMCAGLPTKTERLDPRTELRAYEYKPEGSNAVSVNVPVIGGGFSLGQGGDCKAMFKMVDGRVAELRFAGDTATGPGARNAVCAPIVAHCLENMPSRVVRG